MSRELFNRAPQTAMLTTETAVAGLLNDFFSIENGVVMQQKPSIHRCCQIKTNILFESHSWWGKQDYACTSCAHFAEGGFCWSSNFLPISDYKSAKLQSTCNAYLPPTRSYDFIGAPVDDFRCDSPLRRPWRGGIGHTINRQDVIAALCRKVSWVKRLRWSCDFTKLRVAVIVGIIGALDAASSWCARSGKDDKANPCFSILPKTYSEENVNAQQTGVCTELAGYWCIQKKISGSQAMAMWLVKTMIRSHVHLERNFCGHLERKWPPHIFEVTWAEKLLITCKFTRNHAITKSKKRSWDQQQLLITCKFTGNEAIKQCTKKGPQSNKDTDYL